MMMSRMRMRRTRVGMGVVAESLCEHR
jgi:hypothetical protein